MRILALETIDLTGSLAALDDGRLVFSTDLDPQLRSAQSLAPAVELLLQTVGWKSADVQLVAVAVGPGSFTGLRVGVTTAKLFAYAVGTAVLGVNTLEVIAAQVPPENTDLWALIDAQRNQVFAQRFIRPSNGASPSAWQAHDQTLLLDNTAWLAQLSPGQAVSGPGLSKLASQLPNDVVIIDRQLWMPKAATVGLLAWRQFQSGRRDNVFSLAPQYFRPSAAEEKNAAEKNSAPLPAPANNGPKK
ncbi:MAG TPA: tRNA (adenosine(37)-N6)-threonylcarbamoyltransferase complex dimerization subunit type 1 TsaB [Pirellulales bacterium]|nr:tRNA (adenosine(37)-N6)-threonylcarbamoyltransferase complex dimerization subunit type 1 TsaB [Pirellulales bacterium]